MFFRLASTVPQRNKTKPEKKINGLNTDLPNHGLQ